VIGSPAVDLTKFLRRATDEVRARSRTVGRNADHGNIGMIRPTKAVHLVEAARIVLHQRPGCALRFCRRSNCGRSREKWVRRGLSTARSQRQCPDDGIRWDTPDILQRANMVVIAFTSHRSIAHCFCAKQLRAAVLSSPPASATFRKLSSWRKMV